MTTTLIFIACMTAAAVAALLIGRLFMLAVKVLILAALVYFVATRVDFTELKEKVRTKISPNTELL